MEVCGMATQNSDPAAAAEISTQTPEGAAEPSEIAHLRAELAKERNRRVNYEIALREQYTHYVKLEASVACLYQVCIRMGYDPLPELEALESYETPTEDLAAGPTIDMWLDRQGEAGESPAPSGAAFSAEARV
jgi:hypothetical protein